MRNEIFGGVIAAMLTAACVGDPPALSTNQDLDGFEEFRARTPRIGGPAGEYVVEGDIAIRSDEDLFAYWLGQQSRGALIVGTSGGVDVKWNNTDKLNLTYCVNNNFWDFNLVVAALDVAAREWEARANVNFIHVPAQDGAGCTTANNNVMFNVIQDSTIGGSAAIAFFPGDSRPNRHLRVNPGSLNQTPGHLAGLFGHELGHILGFRHEQERPENPCPDATGWRSLTAYDPESIMHQLGCGLDSFEWWTEKDREGSSTLYGAGFRGHADILWRQGATGPVAVWLMNGATVTTMGGGIGVGSGWDIVGTGDFNLDRKSDIVWRHPDGRLAFWFMNGATWVTDAVFTTMSSAWVVAGVGDFNGDDRSDILWRNGNALQLWYFGGSGNTVAATSAPLDPTTNPMTPLAPPDRNVIGTGDFNRDGHGDVLWGPRIIASPPNDVLVWLFDADVVIATGVPGTDSGTGSVQGVGDFDGDGRDDLLRRYPDGTLNIWFMSGTTKLSEGWPGTPPTAWQVRGVGDFNGDWNADILWRHTDGTLAIWFMNGTTKTAEGYPGVVGNDWIIRGVAGFN